MSLKAIIVSRDHSLVIYLEREIRRKEACRVEAGVPVHLLKNRDLGLGLEARKVAEAVVRVSMKIVDFM